jgi:cytochrome b
LLLLRLHWGFFGSETARFSRFLVSPGTAARYLAHAFRREPDRYAGHNPAGGWMVVLLLALLLGETLTGLYVANDAADEGPFTQLTPPQIANAITALHSVFWDALLAAVALHILAILVYALAKRHNLLLPIITDRKMLPASVPRPCIVGPPRAVFLLAYGGLAAAVPANFL